MKQLPLLIRLKKSEMEQLVQQRGILEEEIAQVEVDIRETKAALHKEEAFVETQAKQHSNTELINALTRYRLTAQETIQERIRQIETLQSKMDPLIEAITELFGEIKKYELLLEAQEKAKQTKLDQEENKELDAMGVRLHQFPERE